MKYYSIVLLTGALLLFSCGEAPSVKEVEPAEAKEKTVSRECVYRKSSRIKAATYPFDSADRVEIVSYPVREDAYENDSLVVNGKFRVKASEKVVLNEMQTDSLFAILYYHTIEQKVIDEEVADCYNPRHAIVFYKQNRPFAFLEICLECGGTRQTQGIYFGQFCEGKMCMLQDFFRFCGLRQGFIPEQCN